MDGRGFSIVLVVVLIIMNVLNLGIRLRSEWISLCWKSIVIVIYKCSISM